MTDGTPCHEMLAKMRERVETERARYAHMVLKVDALEKRLRGAERLASALRPFAVDPENAPNPELAAEARAALAEWDP